MEGVTVDVKQPINSTPKDNNMDHNITMSVNFNTENFDALNY